MISLIMKKGTFKKEDDKRKKKCDKLDGSKREQIKKKGQRKKKSTITLVKMKKNS